MVTISLCSHLTSVF